MKVTFYSCYMNHHQLPVALELYNRLGNNYHFVARMPFNELRRTLGYEDMNHSYSFIVREYEDETQKQYSLILAKESDIIVHDGSFSEVEKIALANKKIVFRCNEHMMKKGIHQFFYPMTVYSMIKRRLIKTNENEEAYMLCASAYRAIEAKLFNEYKGKTYKWGYFPQFIEYSYDELAEAKKHDTIQLLWCGRFLKWKNIYWIVELAEYLKKKNIQFCINMIGEGEEKEHILKEIEARHLQKYIQLLPATDFRSIREYMKSANIYLFLSGMGEGWGAVLNEAMNGGCAVIANRFAGSTPYLIKNERNGMSFYWKKSMFVMVYKLCIDEEKRMQLGWSAYQCIKNEWSPQTAMQNFLEICEHLMNKEEYAKQSGPMSRA